MEGITCPSCETEDCEDGFLFCRECGEDLTKYGVADNETEVIESTSKI